MDERQLLELWNKLRNQLMFAQLAPKEGEQFVLQRHCPQAR